ncbi:hypothetical protein FOL46_003655, partial [Perkinsus olseni]
WCQRRPCNCCKLPDDQPGALERRHGRLKEYLHSMGEMRPMEERTEFRTALGIFSIGIGLCVVALAWRRSNRGDWLNEGAAPEASRRSGPHREGSGTFLEQLLEHRIITHERPQESGTLVYLPIAFAMTATSGSRKWAVMLSSIAVSDNDVVKIEGLGFVDSGESFLAGPAEEAWKILADLVKEANLESCRD